MSRTMAEALPPLPDDGSGLTLVERHHIAGARRLAEVDEMIRLRRPDRGAQEVRDGAGRIGELQNAALAAWTAAAEGPHDYGPLRSRRPDWAAPVRMLEGERIQMRREAVGDNAAVASALIAWKRRWEAIARLDESDRQLLGNREYNAMQAAEQAAIVQRATAAHAQHGRSAPTIQAWLKSQQDRGILFQLNASKLEASAGQLSTEDKEFVRAHRDEIVRHLQNAAKFEVI